MSEIITHKFGGDFGYIVQAKLHENGYSVTFLASRIKGIDVKGNSLIGDLGSMVSVDQFNEDDADIHAFVKWDACGHLMLLDNKKNCMYHLCGIENVKLFHSLLEQFWIWAKEMMKDKWYDK